MAVRFPAWKNNGFQCKMKEQMKQPKMSRNVNDNPVKSNKSKNKNITNIQKQQTRKTTNNTHRGKNKMPPTSKQKQIKQIPKTPGHSLGTVWNRNLHSKPLFMRTSWLEASNYKTQICISASMFWGLTWACIIRECNSFRREPGVWSPGHYKRQLLCIQRPRARKKKNCFTRPRTNQSWRRTALPIFGKGSLS